MKVHFIAIGGSVMHNLAISLHKKGYNVTGSDDEIFEPASGNLKNNGLLPNEIGWFPEKINKDIDAIVLGMHATADNPELLKAKELNLPIYSYPAYIYEQSKNKTRVVIGGSHGKTTITSMILHVLKDCGKNFDYLVGAALEGFDSNVKITKEAPVIIIEGDEYLASKLDPVPKFHLYHPHIGLISGIAWDHINVFPDYNDYVNQFRIFAEKIEQDGVLIYNNEDEEVKKMVASLKGIKTISYQTPEYTVKDNSTFLSADKGSIQLQIFGKHNLQNLAAAMAVCKELGINNEEFNNSIQTFKGASKRLELLGKSNDSAVYRDFAHSPSKLKATIAAIKDQFPSRKVVACMELHTFSSLNKDFLSQYKNTMDAADIPVVFYSKHALKMKKLPEITAETINKEFDNPNVQVFTEKDSLSDFLMNSEWKNTNLLLMSSGNFDNLDLKEITNFVLSKNPTHVT